MRVMTAAVGLLIAVGLAPTATAETVVLPERPGPPGVVFTDNPAIVDPHPMRAESFSRIAEDRAIALHFTTGTPQCYGVHATVQETPDTVTVELRGGTLPEALNRACILLAVSGTLDVPLQGPLGQRRVLSAF